MIWLLVLSLVGLVLGLMVVLESVRQEPVWVRPEKSASPRQRRWFGFGLILMMSGNTVNWLSLAQGANLGLVAFGLFILGGLVFVVGLVKGPTDEELERRARMLAGQGK